MCKAFEEIKDMGAYDNSVEIATAMLADGMDSETVAKYSGLFVEEVEVLAQPQMA